MRKAPIKKPTAAKPKPVEKRPPPPKGKWVWQPADIPAKRPDKKT